MGGQRLLLNALPGQRFNVPSEVCDAGRFDCREKRSSEIDRQSHAAVISIRSHLLRYGAASLKRYIQEARYRFKQDGQGNRFGDEVIESLSQEELPLMLKDGSRNGYNLQMLPAVFF